MLRGHNIGTLFVEKVVIHHEIQQRRLTVIEIHQKIGVAALVRCARRSAQQLDLNG